jgi:hypothetical protein
MTKRLDRIRQWIGVAKCLGLRQKKAGLATDASLTHVASQRQDEAKAAAMFEPPTILPDARSTRLSRYVLPGSDQ